MLTMCYFTPRPFRKSPPSLFMFLNISFTRPKGSLKQRSHILHLFFYTYYSTKLKLALSPGEGGVEGGSPRCFWWRFAALRLKPLTARLGQNISFLTPYLTTNRKIEALFQTKRVQRSTKVGLAYAYITNKCKGRHSHPRPSVNSSIYIFVNFLEWK